MVGGGETRWWGVGRPDGASLASFRSQPEPPSSQQSVIRPLRVLKHHLALAQPPSPPSLARLAGGSQPSGPRAGVVLELAAPCPLPPLRAGTWGGGKVTVSPAPAWSPGGSHHPGPVRGGPGRVLGTLTPAPGQDSSSQGPLLVKAHKWEGLEGGRGRPGRGQTGTP